MLQESQRGRNSFDTICTAWSKLNGRKSIDSDGVFDTGRTHPITTKAVVEGIGMEIDPLKEVLEIIQAIGKPL